MNQPSGKINEKSYIQENYQLVSTSKHALLGSVSVYEHKELGEKVMGIERVYESKQSLLKDFHMSHYLKLVGNESLIQFLEVAIDVQPNWSKTVYQMTQYFEHFPSTLLS